MPERLPPDTLAKALDLQSQLWTQQRIAAHLGIAAPTLSKLLSRHNKRRFQKLATQHAAIRSRQAAQLERMADEAYQGWLRSKDPAVTVQEFTVSGAPGPDGQEVGTTRTQTTSRVQSGDTSFLSESRALLAEIRKVLEMDAAKEDSGEAAKTAIVKILRRISMDDL